MKNFIGILVLMFLPMQSFAQLKVESGGNTIAGTKLQSASTWYTGLQSGLSSSAIFGNNYAALYGKADNGNSNGCAYGVYGIACNGTSGGNFGVVGALDTGTAGVGVLGSNTYFGSMSFSGTYAGYFLGNTKVVGTLTATSVVQSSDLRLKENIVPLNESKESTLNKVLDMNVIEYNYKEMLPSLTLPDTISEEEMIKRIGINPEKKHIGLIAQELQELFPELVVEGQDGYLGINYVELVPVLIRAIQELKTEVDALQGNTDKAVQRAPAGIDIREPAVSGNVLYQNMPNPFKEQTIIRFKLADNVEDAAICIFDMQGKMLQNLPISSGMESVSVNGYELGKGLFLYSLVVNGQEIDTKKMIISK